jgi:hypothetical protein
MPYIVTNKTKEVLTFSINGGVNTLDGGMSLTFTTNPASSDLRKLERSESVSIEFISEALLVLREKAKIVTPPVEVKKTATTKKKRTKKTSE